MTSWHGNPFCITDPLWGESIGRRCILIALQWRHSGRDGVSNHQPHVCLAADQRKHQSSASPRDFVNINPRGMRWNTENCESSWCQLFRHGFSRVSLSSDNNMMDTFCHQTSSALLVLCEGGEPAVTGGFPYQRASNAKPLSLWAARLDAPFFCNKLENAFIFKIYRKISNISCTKFQNKKDSRFIWQFSPLNPLKPGV